MAQKIRLFRVRLSPDVAQETDQASLNRFLSEVSKPKITASLVQSLKDVYWSVLVEFEAETTHEPEPLVGEQSVLWERLRQWRNERAKEEGVMPFVIFPPSCARSPRCFPLRSRISHEYAESVCGGHPSTAQRCCASFRS